MEEINKDNIDNSDQNINIKLLNKYKVADIFLFCFLMVSIVLLFYTFYHSELVYEGLRREHYLKYYALFLGGALFSAITFFINYEIRKNIVLISSSLVLCLYILEFSMNYLSLNSLYTPCNSPTSHSKTFRLINFECVEWDHRPKSQVVMDLLESGIDAVPHVATLLDFYNSQSKEVDKLFPTQGVSHKYTVVDNETGKYMIYKSDRHGFNNPDSEWDSNIEYLMIGDSFTLGASVHDGQDIASRIRSMTDKSVITLGSAGIGPLIELASLREYGASLSPKKILWLYYEGNDQSNLRNEKKLPELVQYLGDGSQSLINRQKEIDSRLNQYINKELDLAIKKTTSNSDSESLAWKVRSLRLYNIRHLISKVFGIKLVSSMAGESDLVEREVYWQGNELESESIDPIFGKVMKKAKQLSESWGGEVYFVYLPDAKRYTNPDGRRYGGDYDSFYNKKHVIDIVQNIGIPVIDIHENLLSKSDDPLSFYPFRHGGHFNAAGYNKIAEVIVTSLTK